MKPYRPMSDAHRQALSDSHRATKRRRLVEQFVEKLPTFDLEWSDEIKARWFDCVEQLMRLRVTP